MTTYLTKTQDESVEDKRKKSKLLSRVIGWPAFIVSLLVIVLSNNLVVVTATLLFPLLAIAVTKTNNLIDFKDKKTGPILGIVSGFFLPTITLGVVLVNKLSVLSYNKLWGPSMVLFIILGLILSIGHNGLNVSSGKKVVDSALILASIYAYCFVAIVTINCLYDKSRPSGFGVKVVGKYVTIGKIRKGYLVLEKWGTQNIDRSEIVSSSLYKRKQIGDNVTVICRPGILGAPWYVIID